MSSGFPPRARGLLDSSRTKLEELARRIGAATPGDESMAVASTVAPVLDLGQPNSDMSQIAGIPRTRRYAFWSQSAAVPGENSLFTFNVGAPLSQQPADSPQVGIYVRWYLPVITALQNYEVWMPDSANLIGNSTDQNSEARLLPIGTDPIDEYAGGATRDAASGTYPGGSPGNDGQGFTSSVGTTVSPAPANVLTFRIQNAQATNRDNAQAWFVPQGRALLIRNTTANAVSRLSGFIDWVYQRADLP